ncbi:MAG: hypothetical protein A2X94_16215 [Bdellovibrionales bacterium GWB1_55_8]|nr:MAG: hypothetical protein A2X94_16215 [Bdellovibrionales bacterium GWB1_55_8]
MLHKVIGLFGAVFFLSGCAVVGSSKVDPSAIQTSYRASYSEQSGRLSYEATFQVGDGFGTYVQFDDGSEVKIDSQLMVLSDTLFNQISYIASVSSVAPGADDLTKTHVFSYKNAQCQQGACGTSSEIFQNSFRIPARVFIAEEQDKTASPQAAFLVHWGTSDRIQSNERIYAYISQPTTQGGERQHSRIASNAQGSSGVIEFAALDMANFVTGPAEVWVCREGYSSSIQSPSEGGSLSAGYCSKRVSLNID